MSQHRLRVPEPESVGGRRSSSEDNLYLAVLRASEGKKGSWHSCWAGPLWQEGTFLLQEALALGGVGFEGQTPRWGGQ